MNAHMQGWFSELSTLWPGQCLSLEVDEVLFHEKSKYQDIMVLQTKSYGRVLVLDGVIQCTERDEFGYQEMISFLPLNCHPNPKKVLVIGGGDGGVIREVVKHPAVESVTQCEIDGKVIEVCKKYLPFMAKGFSSSKLTTYIGDGFEFIEKHHNQFDVIITDSSDPVGPAESLFCESYYRLLKSALHPGGIVCSQGENIWLHLDLIKSMLKFCQGLFPSVKYGYTCIPSYPGGQIGFVLCSLNPGTNFKDPLCVFTLEELQKMNLRYYSPEIHKAAFVLPHFMQEALSKEEKNC